MEREREEGGGATETRHPNRGRERPPPREGERHPHRGWIVCDSAETQKAPSTRGWHSKRRECVVIFWCTQKAFSSQNQSSRKPLSSHWRLKEMVILDDYGKIVSMTMHANRNLTRISRRKEHAWLHSDLVTLNCLFVSFSSIRPCNFNSESYAGACVLSMPPN